MKEEALKRSELMLEQDAIRFSLFLKDNDKNAHDAIKRYFLLKRFYFSSVQSLSRRCSPYDLCDHRQEQETKEKQEKVSEYKKLTADRAKIEADISKVFH